MSKQKRLPGTEDSKIAELHDAADELAEVRDEKADLRQREQKVRERLAASMKQHGKQRYAYNGIEITVTAKETVRVKFPKEEKEKD